MSPRAVIDNLIVGHEVPAGRFAHTRSVNVPGIYVGVGEMVAALRRVAGDAVAGAREVELRSASIDRIVSTWPSNFAPKLGPSLGMTRRRAISTASSARTSRTTCQAHVRLS